MPEDDMKRTTINAGKHWCELIETPNQLKDRVATPTGRSPQEMVAEAGDTVAALADEFLTILDRSIADLDVLTGLLGRSPAENDPLLARIYRIAHEIKGQGRTFGYALISAIGHSLCCLLERASPEEARLPASVVTHVDAFKLVRARRIAGDGGELGRHLTSALWTEVEVVGGPAPAAPRLTGGNQDGIDLPRLAGVRPAALPDSAGSVAGSDDLAARHRGGR